MSARAGRRGPPPGHRGTTSGQRGTPPGHGTGPVGLLLIDGNNLLHRTVGRVDGPARHGLLARLRASVPPEGQAILMLDGHPDPGAPMRERIGPALEVRHAGGRTADEAIVEILEERPFSARLGTTVVTDDAALAVRVRRAGGTPRPTAWLEGLLVRPPRPRAGSTIGAGPTARRRKGRPRGTPGTPRVRGAQGAPGASPPTED